MSVFGTPDPNSNRREEDRRPFRTQVIMRLADGTESEGQTLDIGKGGLGMVADINPPNGYEIQIWMWLPLRSGRGSLPFQAKARVANSVLDGRAGGFRVGLQFVNLSAESERALSGILS